MYVVWEYSYGIHVQYGYGYKFEVSVLPSIAFKTNETELVAVRDGNEGPIAFRVDLIVRCDSRVGGCIRWKRY